MQTDLCKILSLYRPAMRQMCKHRFARTFCLEVTRTKRVWTAPEMKNFAENNPEVVEHFSKVLDALIQNVTAQPKFSRQRMFKKF